MAKRQVFFSFEYNKDCWRAGQVRNMGKVDDSSTFSDNDWEEVKGKSEEKIKEWIDTQMQKRSCLVLLIGATTANRKWINHEIITAYNLKKGMVGIYINKLHDSDGKSTTKGENPFDKITLKSTGEKLSKFVTVYNPPSTTSTGAYSDIKDNIEDLIEKAIANKDNF